MAFIDNQLWEYKNLIEKSIKEGGKDGKASMIKSSKPINLIHDAVKYELKKEGVNPEQVFPAFKESSPEIKLAGHFKKKNQDVCVLPKGIDKEQTAIDWGPMKYIGAQDEYGYDFSERTLVINVRSQMSSVAKNIDTLFERTFAEALNLHIRYPDMVLGEVYLIPVYEYDDDAVNNCEVDFKTKPVDVERYISFFNEINNRKQKDEGYKYERVALLIVDFSFDRPLLFKNNEELKEYGIISDDFEIEYSTLSFETFARDIINIYRQRFDVGNLLK